MDPIVMPSVVACGDLNMLRCFANTPVEKVVLSSDPSDITFKSRYCTRGYIIADPAARPDDTLADLLRIGRRFPTKPVLYYGNDAMLLLVSRHREELAKHYGFRLPPAELIETLVDKTQFAQLAQELEICMPKTLRSVEIDGPNDILDRLRLPCILKPMTHTGWARSAAVRQTGGKPRKALRADTPQELVACYDLIRDFTPDFVVQEYVPGGDDCILSFHGYFDAQSRPMAFFTGRKVRTYPMDSGISTYVRIADDPRVIREGLEILSRLGFVGVAKLDFKLDPRTQRLYLLEINPRYNLWHYLGASSSVNLPEIAYYDISGMPPPPRQGGLGMHWLSFEDDLRAFLREYRPNGSLSLGGWLRSLRAPKVYDVFSWKDPVPFGFSVMRTLKDRLKPVVRGLRG